MLKPDNTYNWNGVVVNEFLLTKHNDNGIDLPSGEIKVESITIHNTPDLVYMTMQSNIHELHITAIWGMSL